MVMFMINNIDYSSHVVGDKYVMNDEPLYKTYKDMNGTKHIDVYAHKVSGSFDMLFENLKQYEKFLSDLDKAYNSLEQAYECTVAINFPQNLNKNIVATIKIAPTRAIDGSWNDIFKQFTVKVEEL